MYPQGRTFLEFSIWDFKSAEEQQGLNRVSVSSIITVALVRFPCPLPVGTIHEFLKIIFRPFGATFFITTYFAFSLKDIATGPQPTFKD